MSPDDSDERDTVPVEITDEEYQSWLYAKKMLDEARDAFDDVDAPLKHKIHKLADGCDARVMVGKEQVGKYTQVHSQRFDSSSFKRQFPDIHAQFQTKSSYWRWTPSRGDR